MSEAEKTHWKQGKKGAFRDIVFLVPWDESNGIPIDRSMWIDCNSEENARLISAAPVLLDALDTCMGTLEICFPEAPVDSVIGKNIVAARAAIAKATKVQT